MAANSGTSSSASSHKKPPGDTAKNLALKFDDEPPEYPFQGEGFAIGVYLIAGDSQTPGVGVRTPIELRVFLDDGTTEVPGDAYEVVAHDERMGSSSKGFVSNNSTTTTRARGDDDASKNSSNALAISAVSGCCKASIKMLRSCVEMEHRPVKIRASARGASAQARAIHEAWSTPFTVVRHRLVASSKNGPWKPVFYKDMGGKDNCLEATVTLVDKRNKPVTDRRLRLSASLYRTDNKDTPVVDQSILKIVNATASSDAGGSSSTVLLENGAATLKYRIEDVSMHHGNSTFEVRVAADTSRSLADGDVAPVFTQPVNVKSKINHKRKAHPPSVDPPPKHHHQNGGSVVQEPSLKSARTSATTASHHHGGAAAISASTSRLALLKSGGAANVMRSSSNDATGTTSSTTTRATTDVTTSKTRSFSSGSAGTTQPQMMSSQYAAASALLQQRVGLSGLPALDASASLRASLLSCLDDAEKNKAKILDINKVTSRMSSSGLLAKKDHDALQNVLRAYAVFAAETFRLLLDVEWRVAGHEPRPDTGEPDPDRPHYVVTNPNRHLEAIVDSFRCNLGCEEEEERLLGADGLKNAVDSSTPSLKTGAVSKRSSRTATVREPVPAEYSSRRNGTTSSSSEVVRGGLGGATETTRFDAHSQEAAKEEGATTRTTTTTFPTRETTRPPSKRARRGATAEPPVLEFHVEGEDTPQTHSTNGAAAPRMLAPRVPEREPFGGGPVVVDDVKAEDRFGFSSSKEDATKQRQQSHGEEDDESSRTADQLPPRPTFEFFPSSLYVGHDLPPRGGGLGTRASSVTTTTTTSNGATALATPPLGNAVVSSGGGAGVVSFGGGASNNNPALASNTANGNNNAHAALHHNQNEDAVRVVLAKQFKPPSWSTRARDDDDKESDASTTLGFPAFDDAGRLVGLYFRDLDGAVARHAFVPARDAAAKLSASDIDVAQRAFKREIENESKCVYYRVNYSNLDELKADVENYHSSKEILATLADTAADADGVADGAATLGGLKHGALIRGEPPASGAALSTLFMAST